MNISELKDDMIVFDIDGVLAKFDFQKNNRKCWNENDWSRINITQNPYNNVVKTRLFDDIIKQKKPEDLCVLSTALTSMEQQNKISFIRKQYSKIPSDQIMFVADDKYKIIVLEALRKSLDNMGKTGKKISMIEDSFSILLSIQEYNHPAIRCFHISDFI